MVALQHSGLIRSHVRDVGSLNWQLILALALNFGAWIVIAWIVRLLG
jgi:hypothetical protein